MITVEQLYQGLDFSDHSETPTVDENMTEEEIVARLQQFPEDINDGFDLSNLLSLHNIIQEHDVYENFIDIHSISEIYYDEDATEDDIISLELFELAHLRMFKPTVIGGESFLRIGLIDPLNLVDLHEQKKLTDHIVECLGEAIDVDSIVFLDLT